MFAESFDVSKSGLLLVQVDKHRLEVLDVATLDKIDESVFASPVAYAGFLSDGTRLMILTRDQTVYVLKPQANSSDVAQAAAQ